jgi:4-amino-4-deoxy-L-arabinose transferase-like glycosyltransferase
MTTNSKKTDFSKRLVAFVPAVIGTVFAIVAIWAFGFGRLEFSDANDYIAAAKAILNNMPYPRRSELHPMFRPPLYPIFIAGVWKVFPYSIAAVKIIQAVLHGVTCWIMYRIVFEVLRKRIPAFLGALVVAINPLLVGHTTGFFTEPLHTFLLALGMLFILRFLKNGERMYLYTTLAGIVFGLATLCRPTALGVALSFVPVILLLKFKDVHRRQWVAACGLFLIGLFGAISPWTIYNYRTTGEFILVNDGFSYNLWLGNAPESIRIYDGDFKDKEDNQRFADYIWGDMIRNKVKELESTDNYSSLKFNQREKVWRREALKNFDQNRSVSARIMLGKFRTFWTPLLNHLTYGWKKVALVATFVIGIYFLGLYGARVYSKERAGRELVIVIASMFVVATLIHVLIAGLVRYRVPYVDPYLSMFSGVALWDVGRRFVNRLRNTDTVAA